MRKWVRVSLAAVVCTVSALTGVTAGATYAAHRALEGVLPVYELVLNDAVMEGRERPER